MDVASPEIMYQSRSTQCTNSGLFEVDTMTCEILAFKAGRAGKKREKHAYCSMHVQDTTRYQYNTQNHKFDGGSFLLLSLSFSPSLSLSLPLFLSLSLSLFPSLSPISCFSFARAKRDNHPLCSCFFFSAFLSPSSLKYQVPRMRFPEQCELLLLVVVVVVSVE